MNFNYITLKEIIEQLSIIKNTNITAKSLIFEIELWKNLIGRRTISHILEIGCGNGLFLLAAVITGFANSATGVDPCIKEDGTDSLDFKAMVNLIKDLNLESKISLIPQTFDELICKKVTMTGIHQIILFRNSLHHIYPKTNKSMDSEFISKLNDVIIQIMESKEKYVCVRETYYQKNFYRKIYNIYRKLRRRGPIDWKSKRDIDEWKNLLKAAGCSMQKSVRIPTNQFINFHIPNSLASILSPGFLICTKYL
jgi:hypothetical protein